MTRLLTTEEACRYLGLTKAGLDKHKRNDRITQVGTRVLTTGGKTYLYDMADLDNLIQFLDPSKKAKITPTEDEQTEYGSTIHWSRKIRQHRPTLRSPGRTLEYVPLTCKCGKTCEIYAYEFRRKGHPRLPLCQWCAGIATRRRGAEHERWTGGFTLRRDGYINVHRINLSEEEQELFKSMLQSNNYIMEHRLVMARHLGRPLRRDEHIHHLDKDKTHNVISNLKLVSPSEHSEEELAWARSEINRLRGILDNLGAKY